MITIIHGDDIVSSRNFYKSLHHPQSDVVDGERMTKTGIEELLQSTGLFAEEKHIHIENFFSKKKPSKEMDAIIDVLNNEEKYNSIVLWESKEIPKKTLNHLKKAQIKQFSIPKSLFAFLDSIKPHNTNTMLSLFHQTLVQTDVEMILVMLIRQIRLLLALSDETSSQTIEEVNRMAPWQKSKLQKQARLFSSEDLKLLHAKLFTIEVQSKSGGLSMPVPQTIDFFLASI